MRSISRALVLYSLVLFALALGAVSWLSYGAFARSLEGQRVAQQALLRSQYEDRERGIRAAFDKELQTQARDIRIQTEFRSFRDRLRVFRAVWMAGNCAAGPFMGPLAYLSPFDSRRWLQVTHFGPKALAWELSKVHIDEERLPHHGEGDPKFFQINGQWGFTWRSRSLGNYSLPFDPKLFRPNATEDYRFDDLSIGPFQSVRRVILRAQINKIQFPRPPQPRDGRRSRDNRSASARPDHRERNEPRDMPLLWILIQCASDTTPRDQEIAKSREQLRQEMDKLKSRSRKQLTELQRWLLWVNLITFAAFVGGSWFLTRHGLRPLIRLSDAVGKVSSRDFRLKLGPAPLPKELSPIAGRLSETLDQLRQAFEREKRAAADISHELRTPVAALLTTVEVALRKPRSAEQYRATLEEVRGTGKEMSQLVERMLTLAWLDAGGGLPRVEEFDATELAGRCAALVRPLAEARGLKLHTKTNGPVRVVADPEKVREILVNLLHNAVEYNRPDGSIDIEAQSVGDGVSLAVSDTGIGIPAEVRAAIFERFYRADPSRESSGMHAGLGLAIVREYVERLHGKIEVESAVGVGSTFRVWLPRQNGT